MSNQPKDDDVIVIMCMRCDQLDFPTLGAVKAPCDECNAPVWMAASSVKFKTEVHPTARVLCNECGLLSATKFKMEHPDDEFVADAVPGASQEFVNRIRGYLNAENN